MSELHEPLGRGHEKGTKQCVAQTAPCFVPFLLLRVQIEL